MHLSDFNYHLPEGLIAQFPKKERDNSRLMVLHRREQGIEDRRFYELKEFMNKGDILIINDTRVFPARLIGKRKTGGRIEIFLLEPLNRELFTDGAERSRKMGAVSITLWKALIRSSKVPRPGEEIAFDNGFKVIIKEADAEGVWIVGFNNHSNRFWDTLEKTGKTPLPPYIKRREGDTASDHVDRERYQTVFARTRGAVAAPTAGLHFTGELLNDLTEQGIQVLSITLHIGWGTFRPVRVADVRDHPMHPEYYEIEPQVAESITNAKKRGSRVIAVGTSVVRTLEHALGDKDEVNGLKGYTDLFILPGFEFRVVDAMITNFHLPGSTLLMLVAAFAGMNNIMDAYNSAVSKKYRFYSYGDAMLIL
ncbi:MAG: tRNA preQ1(34) S-adenosylmethionine ribosyltransferase-isomerase QueA [Thermodesulfobacteriota bacterium]